MTSLTLQAIREQKATASASGAPPQKQLVILHTRAIRADELKALRKNFPVVVEFDADVHAHTAYRDIVPAPSVLDVLLLPIYKPEALSWFSANAADITASSARTVLLRRSGEDKERLGAYNAEGMIKDIPLDAGDRDEMARRLLAQYVPAAARCGLKLLWGAIKRGIAAISSS